MSKDKSLSTKETYSFSCKAVIFSRRMLTSASMSWFASFWSSVSLRHDDRSFSKVSIDSPSLVSFSCSTICSSCSLANSASSWLLTWNTIDQNKYKQNAESVKAEYLKNGGVHRNTQKINTDPSKFYVVYLTKFWYNRHLKGNEYK